MIQIHKYILFLICLFGFLENVKAQVEHTIHTGNYLKVNAGTELYIMGNFTDSSSTNSVVNLGDMYFNGDITNHGTVQIFGVINSDGHAHVIGSSSQIKGTGPINFHNLSVNYNQDTDTLMLNKFVIVNDSLILSTGDILLNDSLELKYLNTVSSPGGLINETNDNRVFGPSFIKVTNVSWNLPGNKTYEFLKGIGISMNVLSNLGTNEPHIYRYNFIQDCGGYAGSLNRTFEIKNLSSSTGEANNISMKFHNSEEIGFLSDMDSMHVYYSNNNRDTWSDIGGKSYPNSVDSAAATQTLNNNTFITAAKDSCDYIPFIQFNQINANVNPIDTVENVTTAQSCDSSDVNIQVIGDPGKYLWIRPVGNPLLTDSGAYHTFSDLGTYTLILEDRRGCIATKTLDVTTAPNGNADFTYSSPNLCDGAQFSFTPDSAYNAAYTYEWDLDNNGSFETSSYQVTSYSFPSDGVFSVGLKVTTDIGCSVSTTEQIIIQPIPVASFTATSACPGSQITFDNNSTGNPMAGVSLTWDFDNDGSFDETTSGNGSGVGGNTTYTFALEGSYDVTLVASSNGCNSIPYTSSVTVHPLPKPDFTFTNACESQPVQFTNTSSISDLTALTYNWNFNTPIGPNSTLTNPNFTYTSTNTYSVNLEATSINGCVHDTTITVEIDENPVANFSFSDECINTGISFADLSTVGNSSIASWDWDFDNSITSNNQNEVQTFATAGTYHVELTVSTTQGCTDSIVQTVTVYDGPTPGYSVNNQCVGNTVNLINTSTNSVSYIWNVPSLGQTSTSNNPSYTFSTPGWKVVNLQATSSNGCVGSFVDSVEIYTLPNIGLGTSNTTCGTSYVLDATDGGNNAGSTYFWNTGATTPQFNATYSGTFSVTVTSPVGCVASETTTVTLNSAVVPNISDQSGCDLVTLDAGYPGSTYSWTGPSGFTSTSQTIDATILGTSTYNVSITDQNGCVGSASANVTISTSSPVNFGPNQVRCVGEVVTLDAGTPGSTYAWSTAETSQSINVTQDGYYSVILTNAAGCVSGDTIELTFNTSPVVNLGNDNSYCLNHSLNAFSANSTYLWSDASTQPNLTVTSTGQYFVEVTNTVTNCVAYDTIDLVINPLPVVNLGNDTILCSYQNVLIESGVTNATYLWNTGETTQDITVASTGNYSVQVTDANGCVNNDQINVTVNPIFTFDLGADRPYCEGSSVILELDTVFAGAAFTWSNSFGVVSTTSTYTVADTGVVYLDIVNQNGCAASDSITILPSNLALYAVFLADSKVILGDSIIFIDLSYPKPYTLEWDMGNGYTTTDTMPTYAYFVPGDFDVTLTVNNGFCESVKTKTITIEPVKNLEYEMEIPNVFTEIESLVLYPNPNNGDFNLKIDLSKEAAVQVEIFNLMGQLIHQEKFIAEETIRNYSLSHIKAGLYVVRVMVGKESQSVKFVKINN